MIPGYDFYAEEEDGPVFRWVILHPDGTVFREVSAGRFETDEQGARALKVRRKTFPGYTVKLLKDGQVWEPTA